MLSDASNLVMREETFLINVQAMSSGVGVRENEL